jgi:hypothetical protein
MISDLLLPISKSWVDTHLEMMDSNLIQIKDAYLFAWLRS